MIDWTQIIVAIITICVPASVSLITTISVKKQNNKHSARQSILQLILEDKIRVAEGGIPENYQAILYEYDEYIRSGGNSYIKNKVAEYESWYKSITKKTKAKKEAK